MSDHGLHTAGDCIQDLKCVLSRPSLVGSMIAGGVLWHDAPRVIRRGERTWDGSS